MALAEKFEKYSHLNGREMSGLCVSIMKTNKETALIYLMVNLAAD